MEASKKSDKAFYGKVNPSILEEFPRMHPKKPQSSEEPSSSAPKTVKKEHDVSTPTRKGYYSMSPSLLDMSEFKPSARPQTLSKATPNTKHQEKSTPTSNNTNNIGNASTLITNAEPKNLVNASKTIKEESEKEDTANATPGTKKCPNCGTMV